MAAEATNMGMEPPIDKKAEKKRLKEERNKIKSDQKAQKKEAKQRAKEISEQEAQLDDDEGGGVSVFLVTVVIVIIWIAILCLLIKLDVGGFGSGVLAPVLKDVPVVNKILPADATITTDDQESYGGYTSLREAVDYIKEHGGKHIKFLCIIAAPEGVERFHKAHPDVQLYCGCLDRCLNEDAYICPGLGDAGDRIFGTK